MAHFVLVHGAWHGGWCWSQTQAALRAKGHHVHAPTLTGLGERSHLLSRDITPTTHVTDILNVLKWRGLSDVILVGHSYGGTICTGVAAQTPERVQALVYVDAFVPEESHVSLFKRGNADRMAEFQKEIDTGAIGLRPDAFDTWSADPETRDWLRKMCTLQPVKCLTDGVELTGLENDIAHKLYVLATANRPSPFWAEYDRLQGRKEWSFAKIDAMHDVMVEAPDALADILSDYAGQITV